MKTFIYGLRLKDSKEYRYIGKSNNPKLRLWYHLNEKNRKRAPYKYYWIQSSKNKNLEITYDIIEEVSFENWQEKEKFYIKFYKEQGHRLTNFLDGGEGGGKNKYTLSYSETKKIILNLNINTTLQWREMAKNKKLSPEIVKRPDLHFKGNGWISWGDFLNKKIISNRDKKFLSYKKAKKIVKKLNIKNNLEWRLFCKKGNRPENIPSNPDQTYKEKGWISWNDFLSK